MSDVSKRRMRLHALAAATAVALSAVAVPAFAGRADLDGLQSDTSFDQFIVRYKDGAPEHADAVLRARGLDSAASALIGASPSLRAAGVRDGMLRLAHQRRLAVGADVVRVSRKLDRVDAETLMRQIAADPNVEYVEVDQIMQPLLTPNDPHYATYLWGLKDGVAGIRANQAWDTTNGAGTVVAVLDTGIVSHSDLNANVIAGYDFISNTTVAGDGNGRDSDPSDPGDYYGGDSSSWHGTHVAGTIAAVGNNGAGVIGVAYGAKISPVRVLGRGGGYTSDIVDGITWASGGTVSGVPANANPAEVINMSLGGSGSCSSTYQNAINAAVGRGTTVVVAAGNSNANASSFTPASCNNVINVAAIGNTGNRASYSNYGASIDVAAPGGDSGSCATLIVSTGNAGTQGPTTENYLCMAGTSMAAPHVAGVVALMQAAAPSPLTPAQVESTLKSTLRAFPSTQSPAIGGGIVNASAAVAAVAGGGSGNTAPVAGFTASVSGLTVQFTDTSTDSDGSIASRSWNFGDGTTSTATNPGKTYSAAGTYTVTLTVTDDDGASNTRTQAVTVSGGGGGSVLQNGVPVTGISGAASSTQFWTINVPAGASNLVIATSGGSGDADLYVRFGSAPSTSSYNCRPYLSGNNETCTFSAPSAGTYHVMLRGYSAFSGVTLAGSYTAGGGGGTQTYTNTADYSIPDNNTTGISSPITVSGRSGNAGGSVPVAVNIVHTYRGDLIVDLVAPDGSVYNLHNRTGGSADNINSTYTLNLSSEALNGTWNLRARDRASADTGYINSWSITF